MNQGDCQRFGVNSFQKRDERFYLYSNDMGFCIVYIRD